MSEISFLAQLIHNKPQLYSANSDASLSKIVPALIDALDNETKDKNASNYKVFIAYQLSDPNAILNTLFNEMMDSNISLSDLEWEISNPELTLNSLEFQTSTNTESSPVLKITNPDLNIKDLKLKLRSTNNTFQNLQIKNGHLILLAKNIISAFRLKITLPNQTQKIFEPGSEILIGRADVEKGIRPDLDITQYLRNPLNISRNQAIFFEEDEHWNIKLHPESSSQVFLDNQRLEKRKTYEIRDETEIKFGNDVNNPELRIVVTPIA
jgi:hypothetical protein